MPPPGGPVPCPLLQGPGLPLAGMQAPATPSAFLPNLNAQNSSDSRPLLLFSSVKKALLPDGEAHPAPTPGLESGLAHRLEQPVHLPSMMGLVLSCFPCPLWSLSPTRARAVFFQLTSVFSECLLAHSRCSTETAG